jgi:hypothetical protein
MKRFSARTASLLALCSMLPPAAASAQGFRRDPDAPTYSLPAVVRSFDPVRETIELRLESGLVFTTELAVGWRMMRNGEISDILPEPGERLFVQTLEPDFSELIALWDPLTFCAFGKRIHHTGEVELLENRVLQVTFGSRFFRRRRRVYRFELTPETQYWVEGRRMSTPDLRPRLGELEVVVDPDGTVFAVFDAASWRIVAGLELRRTADRVVFLDRDLDSENASRPGRD